MASGNSKLLDRENLPKEIQPKSPKNSVQKYKNSTYNKIKILYPCGRSPDGKLTYVVKCHCGNYFEAIPYNIKSGNTKSCGCLKKDILKEYNESKRVDLTGKRFGKLIVIESAGIKKLSWGNLEFWKVKCDCGTIKAVNGSDLRQGKINSCGCIKSFKELETRELLLKNNIKFKEEYSFKNLYYKDKSFPLRFDFAIFKNQKLVYLLEYHGEQHYNPKNPWYSEDAAIRDQMKVDYCKKHNIPLLILTINDNLAKVISGLGKEGEY